MPTDVLFIHSAGAQSGDEGSAPFVAQLRHTLGPAFNLVAPLMPEPEKPSYARWKRKLDELLPTGQPAPPLLVGHSLGGSVLLKYLSEERPDLGAAGLFVVAAPYWGSQGWDVDEFLLAKGFANALPTGLPIHLYQSQDDEVVEIDHLARYAKALPQATVRQLDRGGHTFAKGLPELVADLQDLRSHIG